MRKRKANCERLKALAAELRSGKKPEKKEKPKADKKKKPSKAKKVVAKDE